MQRAAQQGFQQHPRALRIVGIQALGFRPNIEFRA